MFNPFRHTFTPHTILNIVHNNHNNISFPFHTLNALHYELQQYKTQCQCSLINRVNKADLITLLITNQQSNSLPPSQSSSATHHTKYTFTGSCVIMTKLNLSCDSPTSSLLGNYKILVRVLLVGLPSEVDGVMCVTLSEISMHRQITRYSVRISIINHRNHVHSENAFAP